MRLVRTERRKGENKYQEAVGAYILLRRGCGDCKPFGVQYADKRC